MHVGTFHLNGVQWGDCMQHYTLLYDIIYYINYYINLITLIYILYLLGRGEGEGGGVRGKGM